MKKMYNERSSIVHSGELDKTVTHEELIDLERYLSICIRSYMMFSKKFDNKQKIINYLEKRLLGKEIEVPSKEEVSFRRE